jgi:uncharacterized protein YjbJ (UPF0337 family)
LNERRDQARRHDDGSRGKFDEAEGKAQNAVGGANDRARELLDDK